MAIFSYCVVAIDHSVAAENVRLSAKSAVYFVTSMAGIVFKMASLDNAVESDV